MVKKKEEKHISDFDKGFKKLHKLSKPRSPLCIELMTDDLPNEWFIDVVTYRRKSGVVTDHYIITSKQLEEDWWRWLEKDGFTLTKD